MIRRSRLSAVLSATALLAAGAPLAHADDPAPAPPAAPAEPVQPEPAPADAAEDADFDDDADAEVAPLDDEQPDDFEEVRKGAYRMKGFEITYRPEDVFKEGGSVQVLDPALLGRLGHDDPNRPLMMVPGVYIRQEDGYGLRPNIGLRGASSERSSKVTLMEDGILFGPAPYSAPAAYYFPMMARIDQVEVLKGPAAVLAGPQTIGGAINLVTRDIPRELSGMASVGYGMFDTLRLHGHAGGSLPWGGLLVEAVHLGTDGFKTLDGGGDTGFDKTEAMLKGRLNSDLAGDVYHQLDLKLVYSREVSNETYLGLSDADFRADPYRRYRSSALDRMDLERLGGQLAYSVAVGDDLDLGLTVYRHTMSRAWRKLNRFRGGPELLEILSDPTTPLNRAYYDVLTGAEDSASDPETLLVGTNAREFVVMGADAKARLAFDTGAVGHELRAGVRYHWDSIERNHYEDPYAMTAGDLTATGEPRVTNTRNRGTSGALAAFVAHALDVEGLTVRTGARAEVIDMALENLDTGAVADSDQAALLFGLGAHYALTPTFGVLAGVHQGFSPVAPGQAAGVDPERSVNYELGARYLDAEAGSTAEVIGFYNDYSNLVTQCTLSAGCRPTDLDAQFNAGEVDVVGVELLAAHAFDLGPVALRLRGTYTFTHARFGTSFTSDNPVYGVVEAGDPVPYIPEHQASALVGVEGEVWGVDVTATVLDSLLEGAGALNGRESDAAVLVDVAARYRPMDWLELSVRGENLTGAEPVVSRRPYGARPAKPLHVHGAMRVFF